MIEHDRRCAGPGGTSAPPRSTRWSRRQTHRVDGVRSPCSIDEIEEALRDVVDPELGVNIVDLGLVYDLHVDARTTWRPST